MSLVVISATMKCCVKTPVDIKKLSKPEHGTIKVDGNSCVFVCKNGRVCIEQGSVEFQITSVKSVVGVLEDVVRVLRQPFEARLVSVQNRAKIKRPRFFYARSLKWLDTPTSTIRPRTDLFGSLPYLTFVHAYRGVASHKYTMCLDTCGKPQMTIDTFDRSGKTVVYVFPSGQLILKGKCEQSNKNTAREFCAWFDTA